MPSVEGLSSSVSTCARHGLTQARALQEKQWEALRSQLEEQLRKQGDFIPQHGVAPAGGLHPDYAAKEGTSVFHFTSEGHRERSDVWPAYGAPVIVDHLLKRPRGVSVLDQATCIGDRDCRGMLCWLQVHRHRQGSSHHRRGRPTRH